MKKTRTYQKRSSTTKDIKKNHNKKGRRGRLPIKCHTLGWATHKMENNYNCRSSPRVVRVLSPILGSPAQGSCTRKTSPRSIWLWRAARLNLGSPRGLGEIVFTLKRVHTKSHTPGPRAEAVILTGAWVRPTCWSWRVSWSSRRHSGDIETGRIHLGELLLPRGYWCWQEPLWNPPSSLLAPGPSLLWANSP